MIKKIITLLLLTHYIYAQNNNPIVLIGGLAHIGNGEVIENSVIVITDGKIEQIGQIQNVKFEELTIAQKIVADASNESDYWVVRWLY